MNNKIKKMNTKQVVAAIEAEDTDHTYRFDRRATHADKKAIIKSHYDVSDCVADRAASLV